MTGGQRPPPLGAVFFDRTGQKNGGLDNGKSFTISCETSQLIVKDYPGCRFAATGIVLSPICTKSLEYALTCFLFTMNERCT